MGWLGADCGGILGRMVVGSRLWGILTQFAFSSSYFYFRLSRVFRVFSAMKRHHDHINSYEGTFNWGGSLTFQRFNPL